MERSIYWSRLRRFTLCFLGVCSFFLSSFSFATDYYWKYYDGGAFGGIQNINFPSIKQACDYSASVYSSTTYAVMPSTSYVGNYYPSGSSPGYQCVIKLAYPSDMTVQKASLYPRFVRYGDSCPVGQSYNSLTGECEGDPCSDVVGQTIGHRVIVGVIEDIENTISHNDPPWTVCKDSCQFSWNGSHAARIYRFVEGLDNSIYGDYLYVGNGVSCSEAEETLPDQTVITSTEPTREKADSCSETVIDPQGGGTSQSCTSTDEYRDPGSLSCGQLGDKMVCTVNGKTPQAVKKTVTTETTKTDKPDGSKTEKKSIVTVVESCTAIKGCDSKSSTKTETSGTGADGTSSGGSSSCEGDLCTATGEDSAELTDEELEPTCDPATDPNGCGESSVSGDASCDAAPVCQGDAVQCAILRQNHTARCDAEDAGDYPGKVSDIDALLSGPEFEKPEDDSIVDLSAIFTTGTRFLPSACPAAIPLNMASMGRTINIEFTWLCTFAEYAGYLLVAMASVFFIRYVGEVL